jgi:hypothetical protein
MEENITIVFHEFLNLTNLKKLKLTDQINNYFDLMNREPIRADNEAKFHSVNFSASGKICKCCRR